jgi:S-adenosylmethionine decarboxylase
MTGPAELEAFCLAAVREAGLSGVARLFHSFRDAAQDVGSGQVGITGVVLLAESHCAIHTWPEKASVTLDVYVCNYGQDNSAKARQLSQLLIHGFSPGKIVRHEVQRG